MTLSFFLKPRPGELLYSALARNSAARGSIGPRAIMEELFGRSWTVATADLPNSLDALAQRLPRHLHLDSSKLARRHTLLPYYTAFQPAAIRERAVAAMCGKAGSVHVLLGLSTFRTGRPRAFQFCPDCLVEMTSDWGTWHWRSVHQLPGLLVCPDHACRLRRSLVEFAAVNRHAFVTASESNCQPYLRPITGRLSSRERDQALALASASADLLQHPPEPISREEIRDRYRQQLGYAGLLRGRLKVDQVRLAAAFREHYDLLLDRLEGVKLDGQVQETWLASLVRTTGGAQPPLQHLLLRGFLEMQPVDPLRPHCSYTPRTRTSAARELRQRPRASPRLDWRVIDVDYADQLRRAAAAIRENVPLRRVTLAALEAHVGRRDWLSKRRAKMPLSVATVTAICETVEAFQFRRLRWNVSCCFAEGIVDPWAVLRRAGLRGEFVHLARIELEALATGNCSKQHAA